uniref:Uncharacterized protein n=1 Tax=viral metagenome TaxID=1070528 RepID=A0A6M3KY35_9ZZZZ
MNKVYEHIVTLLINADDLVEISIALSFFIIALVIILFIIGAGITAIINAIKEGGNES